MKILRKLCSQQVQVLLERMDNHWEEEFYLDDSKWEPVFPGGNVFKYFTKIEQKCIRDAVSKHTARWKRERAYSSILERAMSPTKTRWEYQREQEGEQKEMAVKSGKVLTAAAMRQQMESTLNQCFDQAYQNKPPAQNPYAQSNALQNMMGNIQFELKHAHDVAEMEAIMQKHRFLIDHEKHIIEHQKFLQQHAPRGYI